MNEAVVCEHEDDDEDGALASLSDFVDDVVIYVSGFVERKVKRKMNCVKCNAAIENGPAMCGELVNIKTRGGLIHPNMHTYNICKTAEIKLRAV